MKFGSVSKIAVVAALISASQSVTAGVEDGAELPNDGAKQAGIQGAAGLAVAEASGNADIVVFARRRAELIQDVPIPVTAVTPGILEKRGISDIVAINNLTPNLAFTKAGNNPNNAQVFLRGVGQFQTGPGQDPKVGVYTDGVYLARPQGAVFDLIDVERVEVLRGPQGTLFGRNTAAGLVQVVSKTPKHEFEAEAKAGVGNDGQFLLQGIVNLPLGEGLALRVAGQHREADGITKNVATGVRWGNTNRQSLRAFLLAEPASNVEVLLKVEYQRVREHPTLGSCTFSGPTNGATAPGLGFVAHIFGVYDQIRNACNSTSPRRSMDSDPDNNRSDAYLYSANIDWHLGDVTVTSTSAYRRMSDLSRSAGFGYDAPGGPSLLKLIQNKPGRFRQWSQELRATGSALNDRLKWVVGGFAFRERGIQFIDALNLANAPIPTPQQSPIFYQPVPGGGGATFGDLALGVQAGATSRTGDATNSSWALFGEATMDITDALSVTAGGRYTEDKRKLVRTVALLGDRPNPGIRICPDGTPPTGLGTCRAEGTFTKFTPRVIVKYDLAEAAMAYASYSTGYSSGGFNATNTLAAYKPESSHNVEIGAKSTLFDRKLVLNLTSFYNIYRNQQVVQPRVVQGAFISDTLNAQKTLLYGVEGEFTLRPVTRWEFNGSFGWLHAKYKKFVVTDIINNQPVPRNITNADAAFGTPRYTYSLSGSYTHPLASGAEIEGGVGISGRGKTFFRLESPKSSLQRHYTLIDAHLGWTSRDKRYSLMIRGTNLFNKLYFNHAFDLFDATGTTTKYWGEPRRVLATMTAKW